MSRSRGGTPATTALDRAGVTHRVHEFGSDASESDLGYGRAAAAALGVDEDRVFKTLLVSTIGALESPGSQRPANLGPHAVAIVPVSTQLSLKAMAVALGAKKAEMLAPDEAERVTGYVVGGISPFGQRPATRGVRPTVIDESCSKHSTIFVSAGKRGLDLEISPFDLVALLEAVVAPIATTR